MTSDPLQPELRLPVEATPNPLSSELVIELGGSALELEAIQSIIDYSGEGDVSHTSLLERVYRVIGQTTQIGVNTEVVHTYPTATEDARTERLSRQQRFIEELGIVVHASTPVNMRNFLSEAYPVDCNDRVFYLDPLKSALLSAALIHTYVAVSSQGERMRARRKSAEIFEKHIGLKGEERSPLEIATSLAQPHGLDVKRRIAMVIKGLDKKISVGQKVKILEVIEEGKLSSIQALFDEIQEHAPRVERAQRDSSQSAVKNDLGEQSTPASGEDTEHQEHDKYAESFEFTDIDGNVYNLSFNTQTYDITLNDVMFPAKQTNVFMDRWTLIKALLQNPDKIFANRDFYEHGVAATTTTTAARTQAIRQALHQVFSIGVTHESRGFVPLIDKPSERTYRLHDFFGGQAQTKAQQKKPKIQSTPEPEKLANEPLVTMTVDNITIHGVSYKLYNGETMLLRELLSAKRQLSLLELSQIVSRTSEPSDEQVEEVEEIMFELYKRGIISETYDPDSRRNRTYQINHNIAQTLMGKIDIEVDEETVYLGETEMRALQVLTNSTAPLTMSQIARGINRSEPLPPEAYDNLARTVKKYLLPHGLVHRQKVSIDRPTKFYIPDTLRSQLKEVLFDIVNN